MRVDFDQDEISSSGHVFLFQWLSEKWNEEAARHIVWQFLIFYALLLVGFGFLYIMMRSTGQLRGKLREIRRNVVEALNEQKDRKFDLDEYNKNMSSGFM